MFDLVKKDLSNHGDFLSDFYRPFSSIGSMFKDIEPIMSGFGFDDIGVDLEKTENSDVYKIEVPGARKEDLSLSLADNILTISYKNRTKTKLSSFRKSFAIEGENINEKEIKAKLDNGILYITLPLKRKRNDIKMIKIE